MTAFVTQRSDIAIVAALAAEASARALRPLRRMWACVVASLLMLCTVAVLPASALDPGADVAKGTDPNDWLVNTINGHKDDWDVTSIPKIGAIPFVNLTGGMFQILSHAQLSMSDWNPRNPCEAAAVNQAFTVLSDGISAGGAVVGVKTIYELIKSIKNLGADKVLELGAEEIEKLVREKGIEAAREKLKELLKAWLAKQKPEIYHSRTLLGDCSVVMLAIWDKAAGTFEIDIYGDCKCKPQPVFMSYQKATLRTFAIRITGRVSVGLKKTGLDLVLDFGGVQRKVWANCSTCQPGTPQTQPTPPPTTTETTEPSMPELPPREVKACAECKPIADRINALWDEYDSIDRKLRMLRQEYEMAVRDNDAVAARQAELQGRVIGARQIAIKRELRGLNAQLAECQKTMCGKGRIVEIPPPPVCTPVPGEPDPPKVEVPKTPRVEIPKIEIPKAETPKIDTPRTERPVTPTPVEKTRKAHEREKGRPKMPVENNKTARPASGLTPETRQTIGTVLDFAIGGGLNHMRHGGGMGHGMERGMGGDMMRR